MLPYDSCQRDCIRATQDAAIQPNSLALVKGGQLKLLGVATSKRMAALPEVPTIAETLAGFESAAWFAIVAPPKTPPAIVDKINADVNEALREDDIRQRLAQLPPPQATAAYICARRSSAGTRSSRPPT